MIDTKIFNLINSIKELTLLEANNLILNLKKEFNYTEKLNTEITTEKIKEVEKIDFSLVLKVVPQDKKISILKIIKKTLNLNLKEAKDFIDSVPKIVKENISKEEATKLKQELETVGAIIELK